MTKENNNIRDLSFDILTEIHETHGFSQRIFVLSKALFKHGEAERQRGRDEAVDHIESQLNNKSMEHYFRNHAFTEARNL